MLKQKPIVGITMGDPSGIGPEIVVKALAEREVWKACQPWIIGDEIPIRDAIQAWNLPIKVKKFQNFPASPRLSKILPMLQVSNSSRNQTIEILKTAASLAMNRKIHAVVTAPIRKSSLTEAGKRYPGHTEFFAEQAGVKEVGMMMVGGPLKVILVTTHVGIQALPPLITQERIEMAIRLANRALQDYFGISRPKIAVAALNPHAGEDGLFGSEETKVIQPAIEQARDAGIITSPPLPADTAFRKTVGGEYDGVVAMYHDQALIPIKLLAFGTAVNLTVGLPFIRTSVDHGTADDIVGLGIADPGSLIAAIKLAARLARRRQQ